jgi:hypothetical protein
MSNITFLLRQSGLNPESWTYPAAEIAVGTMEISNQLWITIHWANGREIGRFPVVTYDEQSYRMYQIAQAIEGDVDRVFVFPIQPPQNLIECRIESREYQYVVPREVPLETKQYIRDEFYAQYPSSYSSVGGFSVDEQEAPSIEFARQDAQQRTVRLLVHLNQELAEAERQALR